MTSEYTKPPAVRPTPTLDALVEFLNHYCARLCVDLAALCHPYPPERPDPLVAGLYAIRSKTLERVAPADRALLHMRITATLYNLTAIANSLGHDDAAGVGRRVIYFVSISRSKGLKGPAVPIVELIADPVLKTYEEALIGFCELAIREAQMPLPGAR